MDIAIKDLIKHFDGNIAIDIPELTIEKGCLLGLVGNNGAGKTTLFRLILDLFKADRGYVLSQGNNVALTEEWKSYTGIFYRQPFPDRFPYP